MPLKGVRYRMVRRGGKTIRLAISNKTGKVREVKVMPKKRKR